MNSSIECLGLTGRITNCLKRADILTIEDLTKLEEKELLQIRGIGKKALEEIRKKAYLNGIKLKKGKEPESESSIENYLTRQVKEHDGVAYKFNSIGNAGVPDRIVILNGRVTFVELKEEGKDTLDSLQEIQKRRITNSGGRFLLINSRDAVDAFVRGEMVGI